MNHKIPNTLVSRMHRTILTGPNLPYIIHIYIYIYRFVWVYYTCVCFIHPTIYNALISFSLQCVHIITSLRCVESVLHRVTKRGQHKLRNFASTDVRKGNSHYLWIHFHVMNWLFATVICTTIYTDIIYTV